MSTKTYSEEFKVEAIRLSETVGCSEAAKCLGMPSEILKEWRSARRVSKMGQEDSSKIPAMLAAAVRAISRSYLTDTRIPEDGKQAWRLRNGSLPESIQALESELAGALKKIIAERTAHYKLNVSAGQPGRRYLLIPYAMLLRKAATTGPRKGVYIALLFSQDCKDLWLTLNQGFGQFEQRFTLRTAREYLAQAATVIGNSLIVPLGFSRQSAELRATTPYGRGYEQGAILSKCYNAQDMSAEIGAELVSDIHALLKLYDAMPVYTLQNPAAIVAENVSGNEEGSYQRAINRPAKGLQELKDEPRSLKKSAKERKSCNAWARDVNIARLALRRVDHQCEANCSNERFKTADGRQLYCEAHHLIPIAQQQAFCFSLDVPANIVALCPSCHAKIHRAHRETRDELILQLFRERKHRLDVCGLQIVESQLLKMYA